MADTSWPDPGINGDADYSKWGTNTTNIRLYHGDGSPVGLYPGATLADCNSSGGASAVDTRFEHHGTGSESYVVN